MATFSLEPGGFLIGLALGSSGSPVVTGYTEGDLAGTGNAGARDTFISEILR